MAVKAIVDVELNDEAFLKFRKAFGEYETLLNKTPETWGKVMKEAGLTVDEFNDLTDAATAGLAQARSMAGTQKVATEQLKRQTSEADRQARSWHDMARDSKSFASNIKDATTSLLRWASITGIISGLVGAGGLFGIDRLAISAGGQRRSSLGLGVTPGEQSAFGLNFGRVVNADQMLGGVNEALTDPTKRVGLYGAGLTENDLKGKDAAQVSAALIPALKRLADQTPENMLGAVLRARHLDQFISAQDFQRLRNTPAGEIAGYGRQYQADIKGLDLSKGQQKAWQDLQVQLDRAGKKIETTFVVALTPLAPKLGHLSDSFTTLIDAFLRNPQTAEWIDDLADGLDQFATYVGTPKFKADVEGFVKGVGDMSHKIIDGMRWLGLIPGETKPGGNDDQASSLGKLSVGSPLWNNVPEQEQSNYANSPRSQRFLNPDDNSDRPFNKWDPSTWLHHAPGTGPAPRPSPFPGGSGPAGFVPMAFRPGTFSSGVTPALLASVEYQESRGKDVTNRSSGAAGYFQFMPGTAKQYGVDVHDEKSSLAGAARYLTDLERQFGSVEKSLAAYNWGPGNLKKDLAKYGDDWRRHIPRETERYIEQVTGRLPKQGGQFGQQFKDRSIQIQIQNNTGGNANVSVAQLSA